MVNLKKLQHTPFFQLRIQEAGRILAISNVSKLHCYQLVAILPHLRMRALALPFKQLMPQLFSKIKPWKLLGCGHRFKVLLKIK